MNPDENEPAHIEPSLGNKAFSLVGAFIVVGAVAGFITGGLLFFTDWDRYKYAIFGLAWGACARLFQSSVRQGIKQNVAGELLSPERRRILGEQLAMLRITRWFIRIELIASAVLFLVELSTR